MERVKIGDKVFDSSRGYWGHVEDIDGGDFVIRMKSEDIRDNMVLLNMTDCDIPSEDTVWETCDEDDLYLIAPGLYGRDGNPVCYEHIGTEDDYPYFSPYLDENLFEFETFTKAGE